MWASPSRAWRISTFLWATRRPASICSPFRWPTPAHGGPHAARRRRLHGARRGLPASCRPAPAPRSAATCAGALVQRGWWPSPMPRSTVFSAASLITRAAPTMSPLIQNVCTMVMRMVLYAPILAIGGVVMVMVTNPQLGWIVVACRGHGLRGHRRSVPLTLPRFKIMQTLIDRVNLVAREMLNGLSVVRAQPRGLRGEPLRRRLAQAG